MYWHLVPKPRSAIKTVEWLPAMIKIKGKFWNKKDENGEHPVRREYLSLAHPFEEFKQDDPEINARMEMARYQTFGLAYLSVEENDEDAKVIITKAGQELATSENKEEIMLRQLLKWQFPSNIHSIAKYQELRVFPLQIILNVLNKYQSVSRLELGFSVFSCQDSNDLTGVYAKIDEFRELAKGKDAKEYRKIFLENFERVNPDVDIKPETFMGNYDDTLLRYLEYTGIFETSGRGDYTRLYVPEIANFKFKQLLTNYQFNFFENYEDTDAFYVYFGNPYSIMLPWETKEVLEELIESKVSYLQSRGVAIEQVGENMAKDKLKEIEIVLDAKILNYNEQNFIDVISKTADERRKIIDKFVEIDNGDEDLAALWLEVNTWKSLVALKGNHYVKRNFKIEPDLTPRSFAGGKGNTPDMEFYNQKYIIIPEVSIQTGVQQWITEGSSVVDHVFKFSEVKNGKKFYGIEHIEKYMNPDNIKSIFGLFICTRINERLLWQFYVLNREAWRGEPIAIIPMEIKKYIQILEYMYGNDVPAIQFEELIEKLSGLAQSTTDYNDWINKQYEAIENFANLQPANAAVN